MTAHESPYAQVPVDPALARLRLLAEGFLRDKADEDLLGLVSELRSDAEVWPHLWAPGCALAAARLGRAGEARKLLDEALAAGFCQPSLFGEELAEWFGDQDGLVRSVPPPSVELLSFPDPAPHVPLEFERIAGDRVALLRELLPPVHASAWATAKALLTWVHTRWEHANDHVELIDAVHVLERVAAGERFACVEYSIVLTQALNAVGIPARRVFLYSRDHHVGLGRSHVVSEAWIDDLGRWVILDGQNGAYWSTQQGDPLGLPALRHGLLKGGEVPRMNGLVESYDEATASAWWQYFASGWTTGVAWGDGASFVPVVQQLRLMRPERVVRDPAVAYPSMHDVAVGLAGTVREPVLTFTSSHPYVRGVLGTLELSAGEHVAPLAVVTPYGEFPAGEVRYRVTVPSPESGPRPAG
ncbi:transglutaminase-like domain-containing protein [Tenggerimyces flavus]|uniref:Transglutaminase family protein n=1 Tax=Tenggerimyces flavus TaxID=1708749 RepID=A0ABV7Y459_9ACTN|nr:transglutaminase-like domain-containing protein [Tenggerimyces flavus]MBM7788386.1 hypothetical protein [Tenggerimyces flavus]